MSVQVPDPIRELDYLIGKWGAYDSIVSDLNKVKEFIEWEREQHRRDLIVAKADAAEK